ncbi:putative E3 ubiquitin-protein ligase [Cinnamomum micranthum f. kanehirae]|uniref:RBR-type E3 ubiquitin transferase n=1 Tax=Cinnamomum micranthum f. kanehirae TaxID=337451 RepID=A0A3S3N4L6_9MAGN|nr:putative E3 ubiquitin-protein ligase [Cinnamomum micranthum f. kanehirae]
MGNSIPTRKREEKEKVMEEDHQISLSSEELKDCSLTLKESIYKSFNQQAYETGQSSHVYPIPTQYCPICMEPKHPHETFVVQGCFHVFCLDCIRGHITAKIEENITKVRCLQWDCERELEIESCGDILPPKLLDRWGNLLCESAILEQTKFYCPFRDCSVLLLADNRIAVTESQCPHCSRLFCAHCKVPWHSGIGCEEFQKLKVDDREREDIMVVKLAKEKKWQKCPRCGFIVERIEGCHSMKCSIYKSINQQAYETGQSSKVHPIPTQDCPICMEPKHQHETFAVQGCFHVFCLDCIRGHITAKTQENITKVRCPQPDCERELEIELCGLILPPELLDRWGNLVCESTIMEPTKFYCPFKDCSALLLADDGIAVTLSECPHCSRLFCATCKVPWHTGIGCEGFQKLRVGDREREDIMVVNLAKEKKWQKCPSCGFIVERTAGCNYIKCRYSSFMLVFHCFSFATKAYFDPPGFPGIS